MDDGFSSDASRVDASPYVAALIPAAGRGRRIDVLDTPKPLVEVGGMPLIVGQLLRLQSAGIARALIVTGCRRHEVERALYRHPRVHMELEFVRADAWPQGLGHSLLAAREHFDGPFVLTMADHVFDVAHVQAMAATQLGSASVAVLADRRLDPTRDLASAVKLTTKNGVVLAVGRQLEHYDAIDTGLFAATPELFEALQRAVGRDPSAELDAALDDLAGAGRVMAVPAPARPWFDVDTPADLLRAEAEYRRGRRAVAVLPGEMPSSPPTIQTEYGFSTGAPTATRVVLRRGFVQGPTCVDVVPEQSRTSTIFVFTDTRVDRLHGDRFVAGLQARGYRVHRVVVPEGECCKSFAEYRRVVELVLSEGIDERSMLISLGGGTVCNLCGFVASTLYRGIGLIHVPTTLMAQCDAAISHKQGINGARGKNLIGSYYAPHTIVVDVDVLATLDDRSICDGMAEVLKHALGQDDDYLRVLLEHAGDRRDPDFLEACVRRNIELKCQLLANDPKEQAEAMVLQYGHEVGHPVEFLSGYALKHGEAVAIGMMVSARLSALVGGQGALVDIHRRLLSKYGLPTEIPRGIEIHDIVAGMRYNKRYLVEGHRFALLEVPGKLRSVGDDYAIAVTDQVLREALRSSYGKGA